MSFSTLTRRAVLAAATALLECGSRRGPTSNFGDHVDKFWCALAAGGCRRRRRRRCWGVSQGVTAGPGS